MLKILSRICTLAAALTVLTTCMQVPGRNLSTEPVSAISGETIGTGSVRVALLVPRGATGNAGTTGLALRNAADLAMRDFPDNGVQLVVYDTKGSGAGATEAMTTALAEGAEIVLGPLFSSSVQAAGPLARRAGVPVVAFSSDPAAASAGVYLLSFMPGDDTRRVVKYSASQGRRSFAAILPDIAQGAIVEAAFRESASRSGGRVVAIERYQLDQNDIRVKSTKIAEIADQIDALVMADAGDAASIIADIVGSASAGVAEQKIRLLGNGQWDDPKVLGDSKLAGGWFAGPDNSGFDAFSRRYSTSFGAAPPRQATLAYDATVLAIGLVRQGGGNPFSRSVLTNPNGFSGVDGVFRFRSNGTSERQLAVYEVTGTGTARVIDPAPRSFTGG